MKRKFLFLSIAIATLFSWQGVKADYCSSYPNYSPQAGRERTLASFSLTDGDNTASVSVGQTTATGVSIYFDKTSAVLTTKPGATISFSTLDWNGGWMHGFAFVDYDKNGVFNQTLNADGNNNGELVSYSFYAAGGGETGTNSKGISVKSGETAPSTSTMPSFVLPSDLEPGDYRFRFKTDWNNIDACGSSDITANGGCICDITIRIGLPVERAVSVESSNTAWGDVYIGTKGIKTVTAAGNITITAEANEGYRFVNWTNKATGNVVSAKSVYTYSGSDEATLVANFSDKQFTYDRSDWTGTADNWAASGADGGPEYAIDGDENTWWHSRYSTAGGGTATYTYPHWIKFDTKQNGLPINSIKYVARSLSSSGDSSNGNIAAYQIYISDTESDVDNNIPSAMVASGTFTYGDSKVFVINLPETAYGRYVKLYATSAANGQNYAGCAEFYISDQIVSDITFTCMTTFNSLPGVKLMNKFRVSDPEAVLTVKNLPAGLTFNSERNLVEGTISTEGVYKYTVTASKGAASTEQEMTLNIDADMLSPTPMMGWLSWNVFERDITEDNFKAVVDAFDESGLADLGYIYMNLDDDWHGSSRDSQGKLDCNRTKFPAGIKSLADYVHAKGMKLGIYSDAAAKTCDGQIGSLDYETIDAQQYADWGCDLLKYDYCGAPADRATAITRYTKMGDALKATGREFFFYICEWGARQPWLWAAKAGGHCWRVSYDTRDGWDLPDPYNGSTLVGVLQGVDCMKNNEYYAGPNNYNDADMMMVGLYGTGQSSNFGTNGKGMTDVQYQSQFSMWSILTSPLTVSFDVRTMNQATKEILSNTEVIAINQDPMGQQASLIKTIGNCEIYMKDLVNGDIAVAMFNRGGSSTSASISYNDLFLGDEPGYGYEVRDLWQHKTVDMSDRTLSATMDPYETKLYRITKTTTGVNNTNIDNIKYDVKGNRNQIKIKCNGTTGYNKFISVTDISGRTLLTKESGEENIVIPVSFSKDFYIVNIVCNAEARSFKMLLQ